MDWQARDGALAAAIRAEAASLREQVPPVRISRSRVLGQIQSRAIFRHYGKKLPRAEQALQECYETVEQFQVRRIATVLQSSPDTAPSHSALMRAARINPDRYQDRGGGLIRRAREGGAKAAEVPR